MSADHHMLLLSSANVSHSHIQLNLSGILLDPGLFPGSSITALAGLMTLFKSDLSSCLLTANHRPTKHRYVFSSGLLYEHDYWSFTGTLIQPEIFIYFYFYIVLTCKVFILSESGSYAA